jgi:hypothetical protein
MAVRGHDALPGSTEGTAAHDRRELVKAVRLHPDAPAATPAAHASQGGVLGDSTTGREAPRECVKGYPRRMSPQMSTNLSGRGWRPGWRKVASADCESTLIGNGLRVAYARTPGIKSGARRRRCRARPETARRLDGKDADSVTPSRLIDRRRLVEGAAPVAASEGRGDHAAAAD